MELQLGFKGSIYPLRFLGETIPCYAAFSALILNIGFSVVLSVLFHLVMHKPFVDATLTEDYV
jgi:hypothetical protein